jgi:hypothetical protein
MDRKRQLALVFATIGIALGAGHLVQGGQGGGAVASEPAPQPTGVDFVSAGPETSKPVMQASAAPETAAPVAVTADLSPPDATIKVTTEAEPAPAPLVPSVTPPAAAATVAIPALLNDLVAPAPAQSSAPTAGVSGAASDAPERGAQSTPLAPVPALSEPALVVTETVEAACPVTMKVAAAPQAMIGISIVAPCAPDARVVIDHEGLAITGQTDAAGSLFLSIPALAVDASVTAYVAEADPVNETLRIPALATLRRFGVQWQDRDAFQVHAFEGGADYGDAGHLSAAAPHTPTTGAPPAGGYVTLLGDADVPLPMQAEIYTFPAGGTASADVLIEAAVTEATCGRTVAGETIMTLAGEAHLTELTLAMPDCDGVGDILVLKNLVTDLTIAAAN